PARRAAPGGRLPRLVDRRATRVHSARILRRADVCPSVGTVVGESCDDQVTDARRHPRPAQVSGDDMTEPTDPDLIALATPYALHAVPETELADIERRVSSAPPDVAQAFDDEVRAPRAARGPRVTKPAPGENPGGRCGRPPPSSRPISCGTDC